MDNLNVNKLDMKSEDIVSINVEKIAQLFPNCVVESEKGKSIDFELLKQELSNDIVEDGKEKYQLTWPGKKESIINANTPTTKTLRPLKEKSVDFDNTGNIYIEGDNLEVLKILQESYLNKIKCIYIDPPYNTGSDFVYSDKFVKESEEELDESGQIDEYNNRLVTNSDNAGKFHSKWLSNIYMRIKLARNLLASDGVIFISIDEHEIANLFKICNEIFGERNYVENFIWEKNSTKNLSKTTSTNHEYILTYCKNIDVLIGKKDYFRKEKEGLKDVYALLKKFEQKKYSVEDAEKELKNFYKENENLKGISSYDKISIDKNNTYMAFTLSDASAPKASGRADIYEIINPKNGKKYKAPSRGWAFTRDKMAKLIEEDRIYFYEDNEKIPRYKRYLNEVESEVFKSIIVNYKDGKKDLMDLLESSIFENSKPVSLIKSLILNIDEDSIILDFFSGSATTAQAVMECNLESNKKRKYILVQVPEKCDNDGEAFKEGYKTICEIGEERIKRAAKKIKEETNANIDYGFRVYKVDSSNMKDVFYLPTELKQGQLELFESNVKEDRTSEDLLTQVILDLGLTLDLKIEEKKILNNNVYFVAGNSLVACFDNIIDINIIDEICKCEPLKIVFKESSFKTDSDKINVFEKIKKLSNETEISII